MTLDEGPISFGIRLDGLDTSLWAGFCEWGEGVGFSEWSEEMDEWGRCFRISALAGAEEQNSAAESFGRGD